MKRDHRFFKIPSGAADLHKALPSLRRYHRTLPRQRFLALSNDVDSEESAYKTSERILRSGWRFGPYPPLDVARPPIPWGDDPNGDQSWCFNLNAMAFLVPFLRSYELSGYKNKNHLDYARRVFLDWINANIHKKRQNAFAWYDMAVGLRALLLAPIIDDTLRDPAVSDSMVLRLLEAASLHARNLIDPTNFRETSNHGIYQAAGLLALASTIPEIPNSTRYRHFARSKIESLYGKHFSSEGIHLEHSPCYHIWVTVTLKKIVGTRWVQNSKFLSELARQAESNIIWLVHGNNQVVSCGDCFQQQIAIPPGIVSDPELRYVLTKGREGTKPERGFAVFPDAGYAVFRDAWDKRPWGAASSFFVSAGYHSSTHKQADDFTFEWYHLGRVIITDAGRHSYKHDDPGRAYAVSTRAHNTVEIDGTDFPRGNNAVDLYGSAIRGWSEKEDVYSVTLDVDRRRIFQTRHRRTLVFHPGQWLVVMDKLSARKRRTFTQWFHFHPDFDMVQEGLQLVGSLPGDEIVLTIIPLLAPKGASLTLIKGQTQPRMQGWVSLSHASLTPNYAAGYTARGRDVSFITLLSLNPKGTGISRESLSVSRHGNSIQVSWRARRRNCGFWLKGSGGNLHLF